MTRSVSEIEKVGKVAGREGEISNPLFEILQEWNEHLKHVQAGLRFDPKDYDAPDFGEPQP